MVMNFLNKMIITFAMLCLSFQPLLAQKSKDSEVDKVLKDDVYRAGNIYILHTN